MSSLGRKEGRKKWAKQDVKKDSQMEETRAAELKVDEGERSTTPLCSPFYIALSSVAHKVLTLVEAKKGSLK